MRPRFVRAIRGAPEEVLSQLAAAFRGSREIECLVFPRHAELRLPPSQRHIWTPELYLWFDEDQGKSALFGRFGPESQVWTFFIFAYIFFGTLATAALVLGASQATAEEHAWGFWLLPVAVLGTALVYAAGLYGRHRGHDDMVRLRAALDAALDAPDE